MSNHEAVCDLMADHGRLQAENAALIEALEHATELLVDTWNTAMEGDPEREVAVADARAVLTSIGRTKDLGILT